MKLNLLVWNINFIHNKWVERINNINKTLEEEIHNIDIIALQEATLPFSDKINEIYHFIDNSGSKYFTGAELFIERDFIYRNIREFFPKYKEQIIKIFEYLMDQLLYICSYISSYYGEQLKNLYFNHPYFCILIAFLCPIIFLGSWLFIGMITILSKRVHGVVKSKYVGRALQYIEFKFNQRDCVFVNIHLTPGDKKEKRLLEIKRIHNFIKHKAVVILGGDFNSKPDSNVYAFLKENGYKSASMEWNNKEENTYPSDKPIKCIDFIWMRGDNIEVVDYKLFGSMEATDHKGIKATLDIKN